MRLFELLGWTRSYNQEPDQIDLSGPFLPEEHAIRHRDKYRDLLKQTLNKCNLLITRDLLITSQDHEYQHRDNYRLEIGITHHIHKIEMIFNSYDNYKVVGVDGFLILNPHDSEILKNYTDKHLPTMLELKSLNITESKIP